MVFLVASFLKLGRSIQALLEAFLCKLVQQLQAQEVVHCLLLVQLHLVLVAICMSEQEILRPLQEGRWN